MGQISISMFISTTFQLHSIDTQCLSTQNQAYCRTLIVYDMPRVRGYACTVFLIKSRTFLPLVGTSSINLKRRFLEYCGEDLCFFF